LSAAPDLLRAAIIGVAEEKWGGACRFNSLHQLAGDRVAPHPVEGAMFLEPPTWQYPNGEFHLRYSANPIAILADQAGGVATDSARRLLVVQPTRLHQRTPLLVGNSVGVATLMGRLR
jgi:hypothetical protein